MAEKSRILVIGGAGYLGKYIAEASAKAGHRTFVLIRQSTLSNPAKSSVVESLKNHGVSLIQGDIHDHESLVKATKEVDVVISAVGGSQFADQVKIIAAIKETGNVKRFIPSDFGFDMDHAHPVEPVASVFGVKTEIRRAIKAEGIPYTFVNCNAFAEAILRTFAQENAAAPPRDRVVIFGDGNAKAIFVKEEDIAVYTIKAAVDPRTLNKVLYMNPPANILSFNEIVALWEKKIGKTLEKTYVPEDQLLKIIEESPFPKNLMLSIAHCVFVKGEMTNFELDASFEVEASELYPEVKYTTVDEILDRHV
ncbi:hypothetical protein Nepgr_027024 [Nepenthes gracilis]|uniref:NmrA-like domain-containing protein n=1 Tax=Nepenthes gracilis TaxID=150966 RepID=A0AAD3T9Q7_NEPGR|nr:hypothetical protein Nepgr_027024 [Nepenthes gracilis]